MSGKPEWPVRVTEATDEQLEKATSGQIYALYGDGVRAGYCPDFLNDGPIVSYEPEGNTKGVWVCPKCGHITDRAEANSRGAYELTDPTPDLQLEEWVIIRARGFVDGVTGHASIVESLYGARHAIKSLDIQTDRRWLPEWNKWALRSGYEEDLLEAVRAEGWNAISLPQVRADALGKGTDE